MFQQIKVYLYDKNGFYLGEDVADECQRQRGRFLMPEQSTAINPPENLPRGEVARWDGEKWEIANLNTSAERVEQQWVLVREERNQKLRDTDWTDTVSAQVRLGQEVVQQWQAYRQLLRDVTRQIDPFNVTWPTAPK